MRAITLIRVGPGVTVQDQGRRGLLAMGLSRGGALDLLALAEGAALLGQPQTEAALEIAGSFLTLTTDAPLRIALTGAEMRATCDGAALVWNASHRIAKGARLDLTASAGGVSYLSFGGGIDPPHVLGTRSAHLAGGIGRMLQDGDILPLGADAGGATGLTFDPLPRFDGGVLRMVETPQTRLFPPDLITKTRFRKDARGNRMGQRLVPEGPGFGLARGLSILSETIVPGDIQITGDGAPFVLLAECQTTGGYPRLGTVLPCDLPRLVQAQAGAVLRFSFVTQDEALALERFEAARRAGLGRGLRPLIRNPHDMADLLAYTLISGVTRGDDLEREIP
jgi:5-oxoprolinase (ATP-hydrolysing) subunit C